MSIFVVEKMLKYCITITLILAIWPHYIVCSYLKDKNQMSFTALNKFTRESSKQYIRMKLNVSSSLQYLCDEGFRTCCLSRIINPSKQLCLMTTNNQKKSTSMLVETCIHLLLHFILCILEPCLYYMIYKRTMYLMIYVDDILIASTNVEHIKEIKT